MATFTGGTTTTTALTLGATFFHAMADADCAALSAAIKDDSNQQTVMTGSFTKAGMLFIPRRGYLKIAAGDVVFVDSRGWPILLSKDTVANGPWNT